MKRPSWMDRLTHPPKVPKKSGIEKEMDAMRREEKKAEKPPKKPPKKPA